MTFAFLIIIMVHFGGEHQAIAMTQYTFKTESACNGAMDRLLYQYKVEGIKVLDMHPCTPSKKVATDDGS